MRVTLPWIALPRQKRFYNSLVATVLISSFTSQGLWSKPSQAQATASCQLTAEAIAQKETLRQAAFKGSKEAQDQYKDFITRHSEELQKCRTRAWPQTQAIWLRLYPCDLQPGALDNVMDRIVNQGYNQVYVEVFYNGQVLLPARDNPTVWPAVVRTPGAEKADLLAQAIQKGHERGLKVYAWMFTMNFGYSYAQRPDRQQALARNGKGQTSLSALTDLNNPSGINVDEAFIDPYSYQAKQDYYQLVQAVAQRKPDGVLFDYIRYPKGLGSASIASKVKDLWIYGDAAQQALYRRALNNKGLELIRRFVSQGYITAGDITAANRLYPTEGEPMWQGRTPIPTHALLPPAQRQSLLQQELWLLSVAHAFQGVADFLSTAMLPAQRQGISTGVVFFPDGNQAIGQGYDSRLQLWERFPSSMEWHPMSYGVCGNTSCITALVERVLQKAPPGTQVAPVIAGIWGRPITNRPPLESQMQAIRQVGPRINSVSHFAFSWQEPAIDQARKSCRVR